MSNVETVMPRYAAVQNAVKQTITAVREIDNALRRSVTQTENSYCPSSCTANVSQAQLSHRVT